LEDIVKLLYMICQQCVTHNEYNNIYTNS